LTGQEGEDRAAAVLRREGYRILATNFRSPFGEIDIVAEENGCLVFVEVKRRRGRSFGTSLEAVDARKKMHIIRSAQVWLKKNRCDDRRFRFDVVGIDGDRVRVVRHAFGEEKE
jgi:putative endonuclease